MSADPDLVSQVDPHASLQLEDDTPVPVGIPFPGSHAQSAPALVREYLWTKILAMLTRNHILQTQNHRPQTSRALTNSLRFRESTRHQLSGDYFKALVHRDEVLMHLALYRLSTPLVSTTSRAFPRGLAARRAPHQGRILRGSAFRSTAIESHCLQW